MKALGFQNPTEKTLDTTTNLQKNMLNYTEAI